MKRTMLAVAVAAALAGCATPPQNIKPIANAGPCTDQDRMKLADLSARQSKAASADAVGVFMVGVPVGSLAGADHEGEIAVLKGRCGEPAKPKKG